MPRTLFALGLLALTSTTVLGQGAIAGIVLDPDRRPVEAAAMRAARTDGGLVRDALTDSRGAFHIAGLPPGSYTVTVRRVGYREAVLPAVRVAEGQTVSLSVTLTQAPRQLSTIQVVTSPTAIDVSRPELTMSIDRNFSDLLPATREASSLIALVPGARKDQLWGGAPGISNDYQMDGISMSHPGLGGDFLSLSVDWIERLDVRGLGVGAENGNFQGGIINAVTRTGTNEQRGAVRTNYESERLTASNFNRNELGREPAGRHEVAAEMLGPIARDRVFYFVAGQLVQREIRSPDLATSADDFQRVREWQREGRGIAKLTWLPARGQRLDVLGGVASLGIENAGINGADDPSALSKVSRPTTFYELAWTGAAQPRSSVSLKLAGFDASESRTGYGGDGVPGVQVLQLGRMPAYQNAPFDERLEPSSIAGSVEWTTMLRALSADHRLVLGGDVSRGRWRDRRTRNGGLTWRPYTAFVTGFDPRNALTWGTVGSDWGGEIHLDSDIASESLFAQDYITVGPRVTVAPGLRYGHWAGFVRPRCTAGETCYRFDAVHDEAVDPRIGIAFDVTGRGDVAVKAHWGRYHQGMHSVFFDRVAGANVYENERSYYAAPKLITGLQRFTVAERDDPRTGFSSFYREFIRDEAGRVAHYRQPYVDQVLLSAEISIGTAWKAEVLFTDRVNRDIVGLVDRNARTNYSPIYNTKVDHRFVNGLVLDAHGNPLVLPVMYVANKDLVRTLNSCGDTGTGPCAAPVAGYHWYDDLPWNPDLVLTTVPEAKRHYRQLTASVRTQQGRWQGEGSVTAARLRGNVAGVTGYGTTGTKFSAGPFARPNERINFDGTLPDALEMEGKLWVTARLPWSLSGGLIYTHMLGERFAPTFEINERYLYSDSTGAALPYGLFPTVLGQSIFVEPRGARHYGSRDIVDTHLEWRRGAYVLTADVFNTLGSDAITLINTNIGDQTPSDPTSSFAATRLRVAPRTLRLGLRWDGGA